MKILFNIIIFFLTISLNAQTIKTYNGPYSVRDKGVKGSATYKYYENDQSERIYNGTFTFNGKIFDEYTGTKLATVIIKGEFKDNKRIGQWYASTRGTDGKQSTEITANYIDGMLNGACKYKDISNGSGISRITTITCNFKNHKFFGNFAETSLVGGKVYSEQINGSFDENGFMNGKWKIKYLSSSNANTVNELATIPKIEDYREYSHGVCYKNVVKLLSTGEILANNSHDKALIDGALNNYKEETGYSSYNNYDFEVNIIKNDKILQGNGEGNHRLGIIFFWNPNEIGNLLYDVQVGVNPDNFHIERNVKQVKRISKSSITDKRDNKKYNVVNIGSQTWFAENLAYKTNNGCWAYNDSQGNIDKYGYLYNWEIAKNVCPDGWHLPNDSDWKKLFKYFDENEMEDGSFLFAGGSLKSKSYEWNSPNKGATNESSFSVLPGGGYKKKDNSSGGIGNYAGFWSNSEIEDLKSTMFFLLFKNSVIVKTWNFKENGCSVRCIRDE